MISRLIPILLLAAAALSGCAGLKGRRDAPVAPPPVAETPASPPPNTAPPPAPLRLSCVPRALPPAPRYPDSDAALRDAAGAADRYQLMAAGRLLRQRRLEELERIVAGCR